MGSRHKIAIIGAGHVGSHCAQALALSRTAEEIVLIDKVPGKALAQALDVADALSFPPVPVTVRAGTYADCADADITVIAIGEPRLPGQTRLDLLGGSVRMLRDLLKQLKPLNLTGLVITITNPADVVADLVRRGLDLPRNRVFGTGTLLDTARLLRLLSQASGRARSDIQALVLGEHGDSSVSAFSQTLIGGRPFAAWNLDAEALQSQTRLAGMDVINGKGSTEFGIGQSLATLCRTILADEQRLLPLSVLLEGEYGQTGIHCGVPCVVGRSGIQSVVELPLDAGERALLDRSCSVIREHIRMAQALPE